MYIFTIMKKKFYRKLIFFLWEKVHILLILKSKRSMCHHTNFYSMPLMSSYRKPFHLHFQVLLSGILVQNASNVKQFKSGLEILPHNCIMQCYTDYKKYIMYTKNVDSMSWLSCISYLSLYMRTWYLLLTLPCSMELYISYFIDPWFNIETQILIYSAWLSLLSSNL